MAIRSLLQFLLMLTFAACGSTAEPAGGAAWHIVFEELSGALFSVAGTSQDNVWAVGAEQAGGQGPTVLHWDGTTWTAEPTGLASGDLYWVHVFEGGPVFVAGSEGRILRRTKTTFQKMATPDSQTVWGMWGASPEDMWAVGGPAGAGTGFIWRYRGDAWEAVVLEAGLPSPSAWFKVWGSRADDVWFCGIDGALLHWDGTAFEAVDSGTTRNLLTLHGRPDGSLVTAVGGAFSATLVESAAGGAWTDVTPTGDVPLQTFGVYHRDQAAWAVGMQAVVLRRDDAGWHPEDHGLEFYEDLHGVWVDPSGGVWAAGGQVIAPPYTFGGLIYKGTRPPANTITP